MSGVQTEFVVREISSNDPAKLMSDSNPLRSEDVVRLLADCVHLSSA